MSDATAFATQFMAVETALSLLVARIARSTPEGQSIAEGLLEDLQAFSDGALRRMASSDDEAALRQIALAAAFEAMRDNIKELLPPAA